MRIRKCLAIAAVFYATFSADVNADTYIQFQTTRYYSANRRYFVEVNEKKRATLYVNEGKGRRVWSRTLPELPQRLFVADDGRRVAIVDRYYGNGRSPTTPVVIILDERGEEIASHQLGTVANLKRVIMTISAAHWYRQAFLDGSVLVIETVATKRDRDECDKNTDPKEAEKCWEIVPYQQLRFALSSGQLVARESLVSR